MAMVRLREVLERAFDVYLNMYSYYAIAAMHIGDNDIFKRFLDRAMHWAHIFRDYIDQELGKQLLDALGDLYNKSMGSTFEVEDIVREAEIKIQNIFLEYIERKANQLWGINT